MAKASYPAFHPDSAFRPVSMSLDDFKKEFPSESSYVEWKSGVGGAAIRRAIVAFSNADGGVLMIGVDDSGRPVGRTLDAGLEKRLWEIVSLVESPGSVEMRSLTVGRVGVAVVSVGRRLQGVAADLRWHCAGAQRQAGSAVDGFRARGAGVAAGAGQFREQRFAVAAV